MKLNIYLIFLIILSISVNAVENPVVGFELPSLASKILGNQKIVFNINGEEAWFVSLVVEDGKVTEFVEDKLENPTMNLYLDEDLISEIAESQDPIILIKESVDRGMIRIEGVGLKNKIRASLISLFIKLYQPEPVQQEQQAISSSPYSPGTQQFTTPFLQDVNSIDDNPGCSPGDQDACNEAANECYECTGSAWSNKCNSEDTEIRNAFPKKCSRHKQNCERICIEAQKLCQDCEIPEPPMPN